jgi:hypothetical protein
MAQYVVNNHLGYKIWGSDGNQYLLGGQNSAVTASASSINPSGITIVGRANAGLSHNRTSPSVATTGDAITFMDSKATIIANNPGMRDQFNAGNIVQIG